VKVGITGVRGFIGSRVVHRLRERQVEVVALDSLLRGSEQIHPPGRLDWVLHFAAITSINDAFNKPGFIYSNNLEATLKALETAILTRSCFLYMSSYVYGHPRYLPIDERHPTEALNPYIGSKLAGEIISNQLCTQYEIPCIILRGFNIYGDSHHKGRLISDMLEAVRQKRPIMLNDPMPMRDYLYINDFLSLVEKIVDTSPVPSGIYNVGYGEAYANIDVARLFCKLIREDYPLEVGATPRRNDVKVICADRGLVSQTFSWEPQYSLELGFKDLLQTIETKGK
jgi:nucleoside-diphosphate-sugar epimerase